MVYAFMVGMFIGLPIGCYLREAGVSNKFKKAYGIINPNSLEKSEKDKNLLKDPRAKFYENLKRGDA